MIDIKRLRWDGVVGECRTHADRLIKAMTHAAHIMPLNENSIDVLNDQDMAWMDQFIYRFSKLQDAMGERLFVGGLLLLGEDFRDKPFLDALNRLEALELIPERLWWQELREFRNQIAHEYPDRRDEQAAAVNAIYDQCDQLVKTFERFVSFVEMKIDAV